MRAALLVILGCLLVACEPPPNGGELRIGTASLGGAYYPLGQSITNLVNKYGNGTTMVPVVTAGSPQNPRLLASGDIEVGITNADLAYFAANGLPPYREKIDLQTLGVLHTSVLQLVTLENSDIESFQDIRGKQIAVGPANGGTIAFLEMLLEVHDMTMEDIVPSYLSYSDGFSQLADGNLAASFGLMGLPGAAVMQLRASKDIRILKIEEPYMSEILEKYPYYQNVRIPADLYDMRTDGEALGVSNLLVSRADLPEQTAFNIATAVYGNLEEFGASNASARQINLTQILQSPISVHPGARIFYDAENTEGLGRAWQPLVRYALVLLATICGMVILFRWEAIAKTGYISRIDFAIGIALIGLVVLAARLFVGRALAIITLIFLFYPFYCQYLPGIFFSRGNSTGRIVNFLVHTGQGIYGIPIGVAATYIILFTIYGAFLSQFGAGDFFFKLARALTRGLTAASAKAAVLFSALLGMISGSAAGNVAVTGSFTIPMMKKEGYKPEQAAAIEAVVSTGGQIMPPVMGAAAFIMAEIIGKPYLDVMKAALIPAALFFISILSMVHLQAKALGIRPNERSSDKPAAEDTPLAKTLVEGIPVMIPFAALIAMMLAGYSPFKACFWSILSLLAAQIIWYPKRIKETFLKSMVATRTGAMNAIPISVACAAAGVIAGVLAVSGLGAKLSAFIVLLSGGIPVIALILTAITAIILGMGLPTTAAYLVLATAAGIMLPILLVMDIHSLYAYRGVFDKRNLILLLPSAVIGIAIDVDGTFTEIKFVNPHAYIYFDVEQDGEIANWRCELSSATQLTRNGWTPDMFEVGEKINVVGTPARREDNVCFMNSITREDGSSIARNGTIGDAAETIAKTEDRPDYLENGQPNISGPWISLSFGRNGQGTQPDWSASEAGVAAVGSYDMAFDDPILQCHYVNLIKGWNHDTNINEITQEDDKIILQYGFMDVVRTIHLDMDEHPENIEASATGHSIGRWEGDTLVVDSIGFEEGVWEHRNGSKHSDQMQVIERFNYDKENQTLVRDYSITDPLYLAQPAIGQDIQAIATTGYQPYNCVELSGKNNIRPEDWDSTDAATEPTPTPATPEQTVDKPWWKLWD
eukprot:g4286.t1